MRQLLSSHSTSCLWRLCFLFLGKTTPGVCSWAPRLTQDEQDLLARELELLLWQSSKSILHGISPITLERTN
jgi:hypothetical protein